MYDFFFHGELPSLYVVNVSGKETDVFRTLTLHCVVSIVWQKIGFVKQLEEGKTISLKGEFSEKQKRQFRLILYLEKNNRFVKIGA